MFIARDLDGKLYFYNNAISDAIINGCFQPSVENDKCHIPDDWYDDVTYANSPKFISIMTDEGIDLYNRLIRLYAEGK